MRQSAHYHQSHVYSSSALCHLRRRRHCSLSVRPLLSLFQALNSTSNSIRPVHFVFPVMLSRRYGSVEKLAKQIYGDQYLPVAPDWEFKQLFLDEFAKVATTSTPNANAFEAVRSQAILTLQDKVWPVVYLNAVRFIAPFTPLGEPTRAILTTAPPCFADWTLPCRCPTH